ncbi:MAG: hypothetical protein WBN96_01045 [Gammaproteobacteria bacterium]
MSLALFVYMFKLRKQQCGQNTRYRKTRKHQENMLMAGDARGGIEQAPGNGREIDFRSEANH